MKTNVRPTSIEAYLQIKNEGLLPRLESIVYEYIYNHKPMTQRELFRDLNMETNQSGRYTSLELKGVIQEVGKRSCNVTGRTSIIWGTTGNLPDGVKRQSKAQRKEELRKEALELVKGFVRPGMTPEEVEQHRNLYRLINQL